MTHTKIDKCSKDTLGKLNEQLVPKQVSMQLPQLKTAATSIFTYFLFDITKQNEIGSIMGNCYSLDHIAEYHIHTDIICIAEEP